MIKITKRQKMIDMIKTVLHHNLELKLAKSKSFELFPIAFLLPRASCLLITMLSLCRKKNVFFSSSRLSSISHSFLH